MSEHNEQKIDAVSMETTDNFWAVWNTLKPVETKPVVYRAYYNDDGVVCGYSTDDTPGNWIEIDVETYRQYPEARVINGVFIPAKKRHWVTKLRPGNLGIACDPRDVCVIVDPNQPHIKWNTEHNEID